MKITDKVEKLNKYCDGSLIITHYFKWQVASYQQGTLFHSDGHLYTSNDGFLKADTFEKVIELAYKEMLKDKKKL